MIYYKKHRHSNSPIMTTHKSSLQYKNYSIGWKVSWAFLLTTFLIIFPSSIIAARKCELNTDHMTANCSRRNLNVVPWSLHKSINSFDLSGNNFPELENQSFINYPSIRRLNLRNSSIHTIQTGAFDRLNYLSILNLSGNKLKHIPADALKMVAHSLEHLDLAGNDLYTIPHRVFARFTNLKHLDLGGNRIYMADPGAFMGLSSLLVLKLNHNEMTTLPAGSFDDFSEGMSQVRLYDNRWLCDCRLRWLWSWLNATDSIVWASPGYGIRCDGPSFIRDKLINEVPLEDLACEVQMKTSGSTRELAKGANTTLVCKYSSIPDTEAVWRKNAAPINTGQRNAHKFHVASWPIEDSFGHKTHVSELKIRDFKYSDIAKYDCYVENIRGAASTEYRLTLAGVDFDSVVLKEPAGHVSDSGMSKRSIIIAVAVVSSIVLLIFIAILIFCSVNRVQRKRKQKRDTIEENIKQHFMNNEASSNGEPGSPNGKAHKLRPMGDGRSDDNGFHDDPHSKPSANDMTMDSMRKLQLESEDEVDHMYPFEKPGSPTFTNGGNTYVSFGSELTDPGEFMPHPTVVVPPYTPPQAVRYDGSSHAGSATPLLGRNTPSTYDDIDEPIEDYAHYPVYDSVTKSLQHPALPNNGGGSSNGYSSSSGDGGGGGYEFLPSRQISSVSSAYDSVYNKPNGDRSFQQYAPSSCGSMPRTPGSTRSGFAYTPRSVDGDNNPYSDVFVATNPYQSRPLPPPTSSQQHFQPLQPPHQQPSHYATHNPHHHYQPLPGGYNNKIYSSTMDYRDGSRYPGGTPPPPPPPHRMTPNTKKSMSVGNLGGYSPVPTSLSGTPGTGPRKPPRIHQSREYMELTPHDSSSDYITSADAQNYSQSYGITPGTPV